MIDSKLLDQTKDLVRNRIPWMRKGMKDEPVYLHSWRVYEALEKHGFDDEVQLAGLLHDIVEDGGVSLDELREFWYSDRVVHLVDLSSHDESIRGSLERWIAMLERMITEGDRDVWAVKLADISDNLTQVHHMPNSDNIARFLNKKCPVFVYYGEKYFSGSEFYQEFLERYFTQVKSLYGYFEESLE